MNPSRRGHSAGSDVVLIGHEDEENLGLRSIVAFLRKGGVSATIVPYVEASERQILNNIRLSNPKIVGFSLIFQRMLKEFSDLAKYLRLHDITVHFTMGGHFPTIEYEKTLELIPELDTVIRHEGEHTLLELYHSLNTPELWQNIQGISYRKNGVILATPPRPLISDLDSLPFPTRRATSLEHRGIRLCSILASRGCYYDCSFCSVREFYHSAPGQKRRTRSPANVAEEMEILFKNGTQIFKFIDDDLGMKTQVHRDWINEFSYELKRRNMADNILWRISNRIDELDVECLRALKAVGLTFLYIGIESGNDQGLITCNKNYTVEDVNRGLRILEKEEMNFDFGFMLLTPDSTLESIEEDAVFLETLTVDGRGVVHFTKMFPYVGTPISERLKKEGRLEGTIDYPNYRFLDPKLDVMEVFLSKCFHDAIFDPKGVVNKLRILLFDVEVLNRFFIEKYDVKQYEESVRKLVMRYNESALETIRLAHDFLKKHDYEDVLRYWDAFELLAQQELNVHSEINRSMENLDVTEF